MDKYTLIFHFIIVFEIVFLNIYNTYKWTTLKVSKKMFFIVMSLSSILIILIIQSILSKFSFYGNGNGMFNLLGFVFLIPLNFLLKESVTRILEIMCTTWIFTSLIFFFSVQISLWLFPSDFVFSSLLIQTALFIVGEPIYTKMFVPKYIFLLRQLNNKKNNYLGWTALSGFICINLFNVSIISNFKLFYILTIICMGIVIFNSYIILYEYINADYGIKKLGKKVYYDTLTGLLNREALFFYGEELIKNNKKFEILFLDLNNFKTVNDKFGHQVGDKYLKGFSDDLSNLCTNFNSNAYRISGDEFVVIAAQGNGLELKNKLESFEFEEYYEGLKFKGFCIGYSSYPSDGDTMDILLNHADEKKYEKKKLIHPDVSHKSIARS